MFTGPLYAQDDSGMESSDFTKSIGVNNLPWDATGVSFRWWKDDNKGRELIIGSLSSSLKWRDDLSYSLFNLSGLQYYLLERKELSSPENIYFTKGIGFGLGFQTTNNHDAANPDDQFQINAAFLLPIGIEHFFLNNHQNISYSIEANPSAGLAYSYFYSHAGNYTRHDMKLFIGVNPKFYIRIYFK
jgi:hypothetical protein